MYKIKQKTEIDFAPCRMKNSRRQQELYDFLISDKMELLYTPTLIADERITAEEILRLDYLESFLPAPIFSERAKIELQNLVEGDVQFYPCTINLRGTFFSFYLAKIFRKLPILDIENSPFRILSDGRKIPTYPYKFNAQEVEFSLARDYYYPSLFVASPKFQEKVSGLSMTLLPLTSPSN